MGAIASVGLDCVASTGAPLPAPSRCEATTECCSLMAPTHRATRRRPSPTSSLGPHANASTALLAGSLLPYTNTSMQHNGRAHGLHALAHGFVWPHGTTCYLMCRSRACADKRATEHSVPHTSNSAVCKYGGDPDRFNKHTAHPHARGDGSACAVCLVSTGGASGRLVRMSRQYVQLYHPPTNSNTVSAGMQVQDGIANTAQRAAHGFNLLHASAQRDATPRACSTTASRQPGWPTKRPL